jgi:hypothetical protein
VRIHTCSLYNIHTRKPIQHDDIYYWIVHNGSRSLLFSVSGRRRLHKGRRSGHFCEGGMETRCSRCNPLQTHHHLSHTDSSPAPYRLITCPIQTHHLSHPCLISIAKPFLSFNHKLCPQLYMRMVLFSKFCLLLCRHCVHTRVMCVCVRTHVCFDVCVGVCSYVCIRKGERGSETRTGERSGKLIQRSFILCFQHDLNLSYKKAFAMFSFIPLPTLQVPCLIIGAGADDGGVCVHACMRACVRTRPRTSLRSCVRVS